MENEKHKNVILFDGVCNFCNYNVNLLLSIDKKNIFKFASLQSDFGKNICKNYELQNIDSIVLYWHSTIFVHTNAIKMIAKQLPMPYYILYLVLRIVPLFISNFLYKIFAKYRYKIFGKSDVCRIPTEADKSKFIEKVEG